MYNIAVLIVIHMRIRKWHKLALLVHQQLLLKAGHSWNSAIVVANALATLTCATYGCALRSIIRLKLEADMFRSACQVSGVRTIGKVKGISWWDYYSLAEH